MSPNIKILRVIGSMMLIMLPVSVKAQEKPHVEHDRETELMADAKAYVERAGMEGIISRERQETLTSFLNDSLPEQKPLRIKALENIMEELNAEYDRSVRISNLTFDERSYIAEQMVPRRLHIPEEYQSDRDKRLRMELAAIDKVRELTDRFMKNNVPLALSPVLVTILRLTIGYGTSQRPSRWDQIPVMQMERVYEIILPGGQPESLDESLFDDTEHYDPSVYRRTVPKMYHDPHPDRHFRR